MKRTAIWLLGAGMALGCNAETDESQQACAVVEKRPVLFVHGSGLDASSWDAMRAAFIARGYRRDWLHAVNLIPNDGDNVRAAQQIIAPEAERLLQSAGESARAAGCRVPQRLDIIAHSMGAVSSRWYVARVAPERVQTWIGLAPANHGTDALCGHDGAGNRQMCPAFARNRAASAVQFELNGSEREPRDETPFGLGMDLRAAVRVAPTATRTVRYFTLRIEPDEWVAPAASAVLDGAGDGTARHWPATIRETTAGNLLWLDAVEHDALPRAPGVIDVVAGLVEAGDAT